MAGTGRVVCFGEMLLRLSAPGRSHLFQDGHVEVYVGGAEANVAVALARIGLPASVVTTVPEGPIGDLAVESIRGAGVDASAVRRGGDRLGLYYLSPGAGLRPSSIVYDRLGSSFATTPADAHDWPRLLEGAEWLHLSGIIPAIGPETARLSLDAIAAARAAGVKVSFDGNFRASMWARWCADPAPILAEHVAGADLMFGSHRDISLLLGGAYLGDGSERRRNAAEAAFARFPNLTTIASTARHVIDGDHHRMTARVDAPDAWHETPELELTGIVDRIGTGDAFAAGVLAGLPQGLEAAANTGLALAALAHATPGDQSRTTRAELDAFDPRAGDVRR